MIHPDDLRDCMKLVEHDGNSDGLERGSDMGIQIERLSRLHAKHKKTFEPIVILTKEELADIRAESKRLGWVIIPRLPTDKFRRPLVRKSRTTKKSFNR